MREALMKSFQKNMVTASEEELQPFVEQLDKEFTERFKQFKKQNKLKQQVSV